MHAVNTQHISILKLSVSHVFTGSSVACMTEAASVWVPAQLDVY